jgi:hypothetical protein
MFSLSDEMLDRLMAAASMLPVSRRDAFLKSVAGRVCGVPCAGMAEIESAIAFVLNTYGVAGGNQAFQKHHNPTKGIFR